jgi:hypothetical protein
MEDYEVDYQYYKDERDGLEKPSYDVCPHFYLMISMG